MGSGTAAAAVTTWTGIMSAEAAKAAPDIATVYIIITRLVLSSEPEKKNKKREMNSLSWGGMQLNAILQALQLRTHQSHGAKNQRWRSEIQHV